jgi:HTH-type transcriptional regulator/antitoxin HigA
MTKRNGKMTLTLNKQNYLNLLSEIKIIPKIIDTENEYEEYLAIVENLIAKKNNRTPEETILFRLLVKLIEDYEEENYPIPDADTSEMLAYFIEENELNYSDLPEIGTAKIIEAILNKQECLNIEQIKLLAKRFNVSPAVFL